MRKALTMFGSFALAAAVLGVEPSFAQVPGPGSGPSASSAPSASAAARADELFKAGMSDVKQQKWSEAEAKFAAAFSLNRSYDIAANLGQTQYRLGKYRDAAENIAFALRSWPVVGKREPRELAVKRLAELRKLVATVTVRVSMPGATVLVDGKEIGRSPLEAEVFVEPGARVIEARLAGYEDAKQTVEAEKGGAHEVALTLVAGATQQEQSKGAPATNVVVQADGAEPKADVQGKIGSPEGASVESSPRKGVIITGIAVAGAAFVSGIVFAAVSSGKAHEADDRLFALQRVSGANPCNAGQHPSACAELLELRKARDTFGDLAVWSFIAAGMVGGGTVAYTFLAPRSAANKTVQAVPLVGVQSGGLLVTGRW